MTALSDFMAMASSIGVPWEALASVEDWSVLPRAKESFLGHVFRGATVTQNAHRESEHSTLVTTNERDRGGLVARRHSREESFVGRRLFVGCRHSTHSPLSSDSHSRKLFPSSTRDGSK